LGSSPRRIVFVALLLASLLGACGGNQTLRGYPISVGATSEPTASLPPVRFPQDEAPHGDLTEWWYYTGHLQAGNRRYGFELVVFQAVRGALPRSYVAHFAITDIKRRTFAYEQKQYTGPQPAQGDGFNLRLGTWTMRGADGRDQLRAAMGNYGIDLALESLKPTVLHDRDGVISFGPAGDSYYYSRTRMRLQGTITDHGRQLPVTGLAWMDHQWGNFISVAGGGWDWYSTHLDDGADLTVSVVRDLEGSTILEYGTYVDKRGQATHLTAEQITIQATDEWTSPTSGARYPSGWRLRIPSKRLDLMVQPVIRDQELDTRGTTGVAYWEGAVAVTGSATGRGYVELTGYAKRKP